MSVKVIDKGWNKIVKNLDKLNGAYTKVGIQSDAPNAENGMDMAALAASHEFGTDTIPSRPFMRQTFDNNESDIKRLIKSEYNKIIDNQSTTEQSLFLIGEWYQALMQQTITSGDFVALSPATIRKKGSSKPLIDTGRMRSSVRHVEVVE